MENRGKQRDGHNYLRAMEHQLCFRLGEMSERKRGLGIRATLLMWYCPPDTRTLTEFTSQTQRRRVKRARRTTEKKWTIENKRKRMKYVPCYLSRSLISKKGPNPHNHLWPRPSDSALAPWLEVLHLGRKGAWGERERGPPVVSEGGGCTWASADTSRGLNQSSTDTDLPETQQHKLP